MTLNLRFTFILISLFWISACSTSPGSNGNAEVAETAIVEDETYRIALVMKTLTNPFFVEMERGAREAEEEFGIELIVRTAAQETSIQQQVQIVVDLIREEVDAIVIAPGDSVELIPILKQAQDAGIVIINIDNRLDPDFSETRELLNVPFISVDNEQAAYLSAQYISEQLDSPTQVLIYEGIRDAQNAQDRHAGALRAFEENPNVTIVASETANWKIDEAYTLSEELFEDFPDVGAVFAANDMMALGIIEYLREVGRDDVIIGAFDALNEAQEAIRDGTMLVTIDQQAARQGYLGVDYAIRALNGETLAPETLIDVQLVTEDSLE